MCFSNLNAEHLAEIVEMLQQNIINRNTSRILLDEIIIQKNVKSPTEVFITLI